MQFVRTFLAFDTPGPVKRRMVEIQARLRTSNADVRWESDEKLHCTVKFLGNTDPSLLSTIGETIESAVTRVPPVTITYRTVGCFPTMKDPRVLWIGIEESEGRLRALHTSIEESLTPLGFPPEDRPFHPHVTLGRVKSRRNITNLLRMLESVTFESEPAMLRELVLFRSDLKPTGSVYTILKSIPLTA